MLPAAAFPTFLLAAASVDAAAGCWKAGLEGAIPPGLFVTRLMKHGIEIKKGGRTMIGKSGCVYIKSFGREYYNTINYII